MTQPCCSRCGKPLTDPYSIAVGMGPECRGGAKKKGWKFPKPKWRVSHGRVIFEGLAGQVEPPATHTGKDKNENQDESEDSQDSASAQSHDDDLGSA